MTNLIRPAKPVTTRNPAAPARLSKSYPSAGVLRWLL